ncbi:hypothetical protein [Actinomadura sp. NEAU-AAG7]|uniref:hypothetical protein n=1 Tax=Actinomadura sp. NEAU-AAG7 TaxID=2839640 RepID=UPI001BE4121B|nr:hypothetical protein [Actinomadura sp. NEAU-AAG7]MBT2207784.1 hypothetical protein [Actinomadura sp. NEAU-AAG7]
MSSFSDTDAWALGGDRGFAHWDGREWRNVPAPDGGGTMEAIADAGPSDAWAVGRRGAPPAGKNFVTQIQHWDGVSWNITPSPEFRGRYAALWGVAALAPDDAWAVGCDGTTALAEHWDGEGWSRVTVPVPGTGLHSSLTAISGSSSRDIWAIGTYGNPGQAPNSLFAMHYDGAAWRAVPMEQVPGHADGTYALPRSVVAIGANDAWVVGYTTGTGQRGGTLTEHWDGTRWQIVPSPFDHPSPTSTPTGSPHKVTARAGRRLGGRLHLRPSWGPLRGAAALERRPLDPGHHRADSSPIPRSRTPLPFEDLGACDPGQVSPCGGGRVVFSQRFRDVAGRLRGGRPATVLRPFAWV